jgi:hypothetical protein
MANGSLIVTDAGVHVRDLYVPGRDFAAYLTPMPDPERVESFIHAVTLGGACLQLARTSRDTEFMKRVIDGLLVKVEDVPAVVEKRLLDKIGTGEGQALKPLQDLVVTVETNLNGKVKEVKELLCNDIDPAKTTSVLGRALTKIENMLDPKRKDSVQDAFTAALEDVTAQDGALAQTVRAVVTDAVKPLADEVDALGKEIRGQSAAAEIIERTTEKGWSFEAETVAALQEWARGVGAEVYHVGADNQAGDVVVVLPLGPDPELRVPIVVEVRDRQSQPVGRKQVSDTMTRRWTSGRPMPPSIDVERRHRVGWAGSARAKACNPSSKLARSTV